MSDFTNIIDQGVVFVDTELDEGVDFVEVGDQGQIIISDDSSGWGDAWGDIPWDGGIVTVILSSPTTVWTDIETP